MVKNIEIFMTAIKHTILISRPLDMNTLFYHNSFPTIIIAIKIKNKKK